MNFYNWASSTSSSSSSNMSDDTSELPVLIGGCQKWVTGLCRRTTCDDVIYALMRHESNPSELIDVANYAIFERWRGVERPLKGRTKILKVWKAWGVERHHVQFCVRKYGSFLDVGIDPPIKSRRPRRSGSQCSKNKQPRSHNHGAQSQPSSRDNSRVRNRRVEQPSNIPPALPPKSTSINHMQEKPQTDNDKIKAKEFQDLVQLIVHQEKRVQEQLSRIREMDIQIDHYETKIHFMRVAENGQNYVQEAYLRDKSEESSSSTSADELFPAVKKQDMDAYMNMCDSILDIEDKITSEHSRIADLSIQIQEESILEPPTILGDPNDSADSGNHSNPEEKLIAEVDKMRKELERAMSLSEAQNHQMSLVNETLTECEHQLQKKQSFIEKMVLEISVLETYGGNDSVEEISPVTDNDAATELRGGSPSELTTSQPSHNHKHNVPLKKDESESKRTRIAKEQQGTSNLPPISVTGTSDRVCDKELMDFYVTRASYPSSSCTTQYMHNKHQAFDNDSNSDTGLSSLHSDEAPPILETLV